MKTETVLAIFILAISISFSSAQTINVCGKIEAFNHYPVRNIEIAAKKSKKIVVTDSLGNFCIETNKKDKISIKADGFVGTNKVINDDSFLGINLIFVNNKKNKEVVINNGNLTEKELDFALKNYMHENNDFSNYSDIYKLIEAKVMGVRVSATAGVTLMGKNDPVIYEVDGVIMNSISSIVPISVKSFELLKPEEASLYGIRGANGVLKIKTQ